MKKKALALLISLMLILSLAACGSAAKSAPMEAPSADYDYGNGGFAYMTDAAEAENQEAPAEPAPEESGAATTADIAPIADKIIYSAYADIETTEFDESLKAVDALIARVGGFLESSSVTGSNYNAGRDYRSASYTIRIPAGSFKDVTGSLSELGNVTYCNTNADNITTQYRDTASRLEAYEVEYDRLLEMLKKASNVEEMLSIESRLSDVRYNIESLTTTIKGWDSLINYSTLSINLTEVKDYSSATGADLTYWQEVGAALRGTLKGIGNFFSSLLMFLIAFLPVLLILAAVAAAVMFISKKVRARKAKKTLPPEQRKED